MTAPTSDPIVLRSGAATAVIYPGAGGRLGQLDLGDGPLLRGPAEGLSWAHWGCYPLVPWSNRIPGGRLVFGPGDAVQARLPVNWEDGSAIHGLAASCSWMVMGQTATTAELEVDPIEPPYFIDATQSFALDDDGLTLRLASMNVGDQTVPMGIGIHPWFRSGPIRVPADERWPGEPVPTGPPVPVDGVHDLRTAAVPGLMDTCFTALTGASAEVPGLTLRWDGPITNVVVYTGVEGWVCVEPVTMATNAFDPTVRDHPRSGAVLVAPGESIEVSYRFERRRPPAPGPSPTDPMR